MYNEYSGGILISNDEMELAEIVNLKNSPEIIVSKFKKKIAWIQETECTLTLHYKKYELNKYCTYNDFYGYESSKKTCIEEAEEYVKDMEIDKKSGLFFKVTQTVTRRPVIFIEQKPGYKIAYRKLSDDKLYMYHETKTKELVEILKRNPRSETVADRMFELIDELQVKDKVWFHGEVWNSQEGHILYEVKP